MHYHRPRLIAICRMHIKASLVWQREGIAFRYQTMDLEAPELVQHKPIPPSSPPIPYLRLYLNGIACHLCESQPYVYCSEGSMREHLKDIHHWTSGEKGGQPTKASQAAYAAFGTPFSKVTISPVACQNFFRSNFFRFFIVTPVKDTTPEYSCQPTGRIQPT